MKNSGVLEITRRIPEKKASMKTRCIPGVLTVLIDEAGDGVLLSYINTFAGKDTSNRFTFQIGGTALDPTKQQRVGFGDRLPDELSIAQYLLECGFSSEEVEQAMKDYDLEQYSYLTCGALNATATRQLELLKALHSDSPILLCNDPFQPFNGRWREDFAKLFMQTVEGSGRIVVVTNLSFMPQSWGKDSRIQTIDVGKAAEVALKKAEAEARRQAALEEQRKIAEQNALLAAEAAEGMPDGEEYDPEKEIPIALPKNFQFAYKASKDYIFTPLANLSNIVRTYSLLIVPGAIVCLALMIGLIMYPSLGKRPSIKLANKQVSEPAKKITQNDLEEGSDSVQPEAIDLELEEEPGAILRANQDSSELPAKPIFIEKINAIIEAENQKAPAQSPDALEKVKAAPRPTIRDFDPGVLALVGLSKAAPEVCQVSSNPSCSAESNSELTCK